MSVKTVPVIGTQYRHVGKRSLKCVTVEAKRTLSRRCFIRFIPHTAWIPCNGDLLAYVIIPVGKRWELPYAKKPLAKTTDTWVQHIPAKTTALLDFLIKVEAYGGKSATDYVSQCVENYINAHKAKRTKALTASIRKPNGQDY